MRVIMLQKVMVTGLECECAPLDQWRFVKKNCYKIVYNIENDVSTIRLHRVTRIGTGLPPTLPLS